MGGPRMRTLIFTFAFWILPVGLLMADDQPPPERLRMPVQEAIPAWWSVQDVKVTASVNQGDAVDPKLKQRFEATALPRVQLFAEVQTEIEAVKPFKRVISTMPAGKPRTIYGVATCTYVAGVWTVDL